MAISTLGVKKRLIGLEGWLTRASLLATPYTDTDIQTAITLATRQFELDTQFDVTKRQNYSQADGTYVTTEGASVDTTFKPYREDPYNFYLGDSIEFFKVNLKRRPVIDVQRVRIMWNRNQVIYTLPPEWLQVDRYSGRFTIMPFSGSVQVVASGVAFNQIMISMGAHDYLPALINIDYTSGLPTDWETDSDWSPLVRAIEEYAAYYVCQDLVEIMPQGLKSSMISADGASQELDYSYFEMKRNTLLSSVQKYQNVLRQQFRPIQLDIV